MTTIEERVEAGAKWLDANRPGWVDRINLKTLNLGDPCKCVLGQEYGHFNSRPFTAAMDAPAGLGFERADLPYVDRSFEAAQREYTGLTQAWRDYITARRAAA